MISVLVYLSPWVLKNHRWEVPVGVKKVTAQLIRPHLVRIAGEDGELILDKQELQNALYALNLEAPE